MDEESKAVNQEVVADTTPTESAPAEKESEVTEQDYFDEGFNETGEMSEADLDKEDDDDGQQSDESKDDVREQGDNQVPPEAKAQKSINRFQQLANENRELKERLERLNMQESQLATEQELLDQVNPETGEFYSPEDARRIATYQANQQAQARLQAERAQLQVRENINASISDTERAIKDFHQLDRESPEYDADLAADFDAEMQQSAILDNRGNLLGFRQSPYEISKRLVDIANRVAARERTMGQAKAQRSIERMMSNADTVPGAAQAGAKFEHLSTAQMAERLRRQGHDI